MGETTFELTQVMLGMEPYVLLRFRLGDEGDDDLRMIIDAGGGVTQGDLRDVLEAALESLPGAEVDDHG
jgi:hypothetical protein